jgi:asparagine synthase (glutamine-hydrolysing)
MCGIFFYRSLIPIRGNQKGLIEEWFGKIKHRGPDASRVRYYNENVMMGFHRLAIVDPTGDGMQPFELNTSTSSYACMVNGEIYNYKELQQQHNFDLSSHSDCEIVIHLFAKIVGVDLPQIGHIRTLCEMLDGEFAFIIYDIKNDVVFYGVDELRVRPLFFKDTHQYIIMASEQKAMGNDYSHSVVAIQSAEIGMIASGQHKKDTYFEFKSTYDCDMLSNSISKADSALVLRELIIENLKKKIHPEREFGFLLSGGLDSSLICGIAANILAPTRIRTFTVGFDINASDVIAARKVAKHIDSIHSEYIFSYADGIAILKDVIYANESWDQTTTRASVPMSLCVRAIKKEHPSLAVLYSGEVSDELFMGYLEWQSAPSAVDAINHVARRLRDITYFDGLRADRTISNYGIELRTPFFSTKILKYVLNIDPKFLMPQHNDGIEKWLLRTAFDGLDYIPEDILWRTKHAFSDATSIVGQNSWKEYLKSYADTQITDSRFEKRKNIHGKDHDSCIVFASIEKMLQSILPQTKEDMLYREIFDTYGFDAKCIPYKWLPAWAPSDLTDASATALQGFKE